MNLHNIVVGDVKVNKLVFGVILTTLILVYIVAVPILYRRVSYIKNLLDNWYIPVPKVRHSVAYLVIMLIILIIPNSKKWELLEFGSVLIFFLIMLTPYNHRIFRIIPE
jgi:hypothetical protein